MTAEQMVFVVEQLNRAVDDYSNWEDYALVEALTSALTVITQTCEMCAHRTDRHPDMPDMDSPSCLNLGWPCALMGNRCGAWRAKEEP